MNTKVAKELRQMIREEMPKMIESEYSKANHTKLAAEMRTIIAEIAPTMLEQAVMKALYDKIAAEVKQRMDNIDKYIKESNEHRVAKLEEFIKSKSE